MSGLRFVAPTLAALSAALLALSAAPALAEPAHTNTSGYHAGYNSGYHPGYNSGYHSGYNSGYYPGYFSGYHGAYNGFHSGYYGRYNGYPGGYYPGYFSRQGAYYPYSGLGVYAPSAYPYYSYSPADLSAGYTGETPPEAQPPGPPPPDGAAAVGVVVPPDAQVWFNDSPTQQKGEEREFVTPTLPVGRTFQYDVRARWTDNGQVVDRTRTVEVRANARSVVDFTQPEQVGPPK